MTRTIRVLIVLAILAGIGFAADRYAAHVAAGEIASAVQTDAKLARKPHVTIKGFPFLTQVADGKYKHIDVTATDVFQQGEPQGSGAQARHHHPLIRGRRRCKGTSRRCRCGR